VVVSTTPTNCTVRVDNLVDKNADIKGKPIVSLPSMRLMIF
jgi:hypothetical protein